MVFGVRTTSPVNILCMKLGQGLEMAVGFLCSKVFHGYTPNDMENVFQMADDRTLEINYARKCLEEDISLVSTY